PRDAGAAAPLAEILRRPGVPIALLGAVASFAVMVGVMNLSGYVAVGHGHSHGSIFTVISLHIVGMYGLIIVVGDLVERIGRRRRLFGGRFGAARSGRGDPRRSARSVDPPATIRLRRTPCPPFLRMKTYSAKPGEIARDWYLVDAEGQTLGRLATRIADALRG